MNIVEHIDRYNDQNVYFCDPIKNNIMNDGYFIRILYSTPLFTLNGISLLLTFHDLVIEKYYNKFKCTFHPNQHKHIIEQIKHIEEMLLQHVHIKNKIPQYKILEQLKCGHIKIFSDSIDKIHTCFMLKISGIWETDCYYGITYKFAKINL